MTTTRLLAASVAAALAAGTGPVLAQDPPPDPVAGQCVFNQCRACHTVNQGGRSGVGPNLHGMFGRAAGAVQGFRYSSDMQAKAAGGLAWNEETLRAYVTNPKAVVPALVAPDAPNRAPRQAQHAAATRRRLRLTRGGSAHRTGDAHPSPCLSHRTTGRSAAKRRIRGNRDHSLSAGVRTGSVSKRVVQKQCSPIPRSPRTQSGTALLEGRPLPYQGSALPLSYSSGPARKPRRS